MTDADGQALLEYTPAQAESLMHSLKQAARVIGPYVNVNKKDKIL